MIVILFGVIICIQVVIYCRTNNRLKKEIRMIERLYRNDKIMSKKLQELVISQSEANRVKTEILSNLSVEYRTPLNAILGFSELLQNAYNPYERRADKKIDYDKCMEYAKHIHDAGTQILSSINTLVEINQQDHNFILDCEEMQLKDTVYQALNFVYDKMARKQISEKVDIDSNVILYCDIRTFKKILINILQNAIKFNMNKGHIFISCLESDDFLTIKVQDTGIGIPKNDLDAIFEPFYRVQNAINSSSAGMGLGLSITKRLVEMLKGQIIIESEVDVGTTVFIKLPKKCEY